MTGTADRTHEVLLRVADFLRKLPADQIEALAAGEVKLELAGVVRRGTRPPVPLNVDIARINSDLKALTDRDSATRYLKDLNLKRDELAELAKRLDVPVKSKDAMATITNLIVEQKVGRKLISDAIFSRR